MSTTAPVPSSSKKNEALKSNIAYDEDEPVSLALLDPNTVGIEFYDDILMVYILGVVQDIDILQDLNLSESLVTENLSIDISLDKDKEGANKY